MNFADYARIIPKNHPYSQNNLLLFDLNLIDIYLIFQKDGNKDDMKIKKQKMTAFL